MDIVEIVRRAAADLGYIDASGALQPLDSVSIIDLVTALEDTCGVSFPMPELRQEHFVSIESVAALTSETLATQSKRTKKTA